MEDFDQGENYPESSSGGDGSLAGLYYIIFIAVLMISNALCGS